MTGCLEGVVCQPYVIGIDVSVGQELFGEEIPDSTCRIFEITALPNAQACTGVGIHCPYYLLLRGNVQNRFFLAMAGFSAAVGHRGLFIRLDIYHRIGKDGIERCHDLVAINQGAVYIRALDFFAVNPDFSSLYLHSRHLTQYFEGIVAFHGSDGRSIEYQCVLMVRDYRCISPDACLGQCRNLALQFNEYYVFAGKQLYVLLRYFIFASSADYLHHADTHAFAIEQPVCGCNRFQCIFA